MSSYLCFCFFLTSLFLVPSVRTEVNIIQDNNNVKDEIYNAQRKVSKESIYKVAVQLDKDDQKLADEIAHLHGFKNRGKIGSLDGFFEFEHDPNSGIRERRSLRVKRFAEHPRVLWAEEQVEFERFKRGYEEDTRQYLICENKLKREEYSQKNKDKLLAIEKRKYSHFFHDPKFNKQWYICNYGQLDTRPENDINVIDVYKRGITGKGVKISILDDGLDWKHPDLGKNYDPLASTNLNKNIGFGEHDPRPRDSDDYNAHGTKCGGEVAAEANNTICGAGIAPSAKLGGVRMLDTENGKSTDSLEARALSFKRDYIDIYSNCWGPKDDGKTFGGPGILGKRALMEGTKYGRGGKGVIFVWATGNGGAQRDNCDCDGYTSSIYTISIGSINKHGKTAYYSEKCASTTAVIYTDSPIVTTTLHKQCTESFLGTSAAAPLAAGVFALVLEANPNLTWRDLQHLIAKTAKITNKCDPGWRKNAAGFHFNLGYGFGRIDANALVTAALHWKNVDQQLNCTLEGSKKKLNIPRGGKVLISETLSGCAITKLEHVQFIVTLKHRRRGDLNIVIKSPQGTESTLLTNRRDHSRKGLKDWAFMTLHFWGENPTGKWQVVINDKPQSLISRRLNFVRKSDIPEVMEDSHDELYYGRSREDYVKDEIPEVMEDPRDELHHGRTGEDYMRDEILQEDDVSQRDDIPFNFYDEESSVSGQILEYSFMFYGTEK